MLAAGLEQNRQRKSDDGAETNPPGKFDHRQPRRLRVELAPEKSGDVVGQTTQDRDNDEADNHVDDVAAVVAAALGNNSAEKNTKQRAVRVTKNPQHDRYDPHVGVNDDEIRSCG